MSKRVKRLYEQFQPNNYELALDLDKDKMTFSGKVVITGKKVGRPSQRITLHQNGLKISSAKITKHDKKGDLELPVARINNQNSFHEVRLHCEQMVYPGNYTIAVEFSGKITDGMTGIYPCYFKDGKADKKLIMTQFESHFARQAFPCIDEPEAKATFDLSLTTETDIEVLSNTPIKTQTSSKNRLVTKFEKTPKMSTYLLAFVYGDLQKKTTKTTSGVTVSTWATTAQPADSLDFALDMAKQTVEYFEDYFGVPYPLPKLDHVACPDFSAGAMENWGLVTYRERVLLAYPGDSSQSILEQIALVIAHETSHQWFGNLVTMKWWNELWLNESFANMMEYQAIDTIKPEWKVWNEFVAHEGLSALHRDSTPGVQTIKSDVRHPDEINTLFDPSIVYAKGGRLLYMLKNYIGEKSFKQGLANYFKNNAYANTEGADLWKELSQTSKYDIASFMAPWQEQAGYPLLTVAQKGKHLTIKQEHFSDDRARADSERQWPVPMFASQPDLPAVLDGKELSVNLKSDEIVRLNCSGKGHYLVKYQNETQMKAILRQMKDGQIDEAERLMLLNSVSMQARAGYDSFVSALNLLAAYQDEASEPVWNIISSIIGTSGRFIDLDKSLEPKIKSLARDMSASQLARLGWEESKDQSAADSKLRALILSLSAFGEDKVTIKTGLELFAKYQKQSRAVPAELRTIVFAIAVKHGISQDIDFLLNLHDKTANSDLKADVCVALTGTRDEKLAKRLLDRITDSQIIKPQDADRWLIYLLRNRHTRKLAWDWMENNWGWVERTYSEDKSYDMLPRYAATTCNTPEMAKRYDKFFLPKINEITLKRNIEMGHAEISARVAWLTRDLNGVQRFFK